MQVDVKLQSPIEREISLGKLRKVKEVTYWNALFPILIVERIGSEDKEKAVKVFALKLLSGIVRY